MRKVPLVRRTPLRQVSERRAARLGRPKPKPSTGPDRATRELVAERDDWRCVSCGTPLIGQQASLQHRKPRGSGGTSAPAINRPSNLILLCGTATSGCHLAAEQRQERSRDLGYWVPSWRNPAEVAVYHSQHGLVWLDDEGGFSYTPPTPEGEAS